MLIGREDPCNLKGLGLLEAVGQQPRGVEGAGIVRIAKHPKQPYVMLADDNGKELTGWLTMEEAALWLDGYFAGKGWLPGGGSDGNGKPS